MKRLAFAFLVVLALACARGWAVELGTVGAIVQEAFPEAKVTMIGETEGVLDGVLADKQGADPFTVAPVRTFKHEETDYVVMVVCFPFKEGSPLNDYLSGKEVDLPAHKAVLISARTEAPYEPRCVTLDERAAVCESGDFPDVGVADYLMDGSQQLALSGMSFYLLDDPREIIHSHWYVIYRLPEFDVCFRKPTLRIVYSENGQTEYTGACQVRFEGTGKEDGRRIVVLDENNEKLNVLPVKEGKVDFREERPWEREKAEVERRRSKGRNTARVRVVDETGTPVPEVRITGNYPVSSGPWSEARYEPFKGQTDASGRFSVEVTDSATVHAYAPGYYPKKVEFSQDDFPEDEQVVVLEKELPRVLMYQSRLQTEWETDQGKYEYGVRFVDTYEAGRRISIAKDRGEADMWVVATKTGEPKSEGIPARHERLKLFHVSLECRNGWELAPAGREVPGKTMREAPEEGYVGKFEGVAADIPTLFYLRKDGGVRYGKIYVEFRDFSGRRTIMRGLDVSYSVQAKNVGSRYLNPAKR